MVPKKEPLENGEKIDDKKMKELIETLVGKEEVDNAVVKLKELIKKHHVVLDTNSMHALVLGISLEEVGREQPEEVQLVAKLAVYKMMKEYGVDH